MGSKIVESSTPKLWDFLHHLWPYVTGLFLTIGTVFSMWWADRRDTKKRIGNIEVLVENLVTKEELHECREDVRTADDISITRLYEEVRENNRINQSQHHDILKTMAEMSTKL